MSSFPQKRESSKITPAPAGVTALETFYEAIKGCNRKGSNQDWNLQHPITPLLHHSSFAEPPPHPAGMPLQGAAYLRRVSSLLTSLAVSVSRRHSYPFCWDKAVWVTAPPEALQSIFRTSTRAGTQRYILRSRLSHLQALQSR